jgi:hypothetical protein
VSNNEDEADISIIKWKKRLSNKYRESVFLVDGEYGNGIFRGEPGSIKFIS